jgi:two-component system chemotaxis sensor kinase CheA
MGSGISITFEKEHLPLSSLARSLGLEGGEETHALIVELGERRFAIAIEQLCGEQSVLRRPADVPLAALRVGSASALTDEGHVVLLPSLSEVLRRTHAVRRAAQTRARKAELRSRKRALVVDDSAVIRDLLAELFTGAGFTVVQAGDGREALDELEKSSCDVIVTDLEMPRLDGFELTRAIRKRGQQTPVVIVTTRGSAEDRRRAAESGADAYVVKDDFREGELLGVVRGLVEAKA